MLIETWWLFLGAVFLLCGTPGPNMLHVMTRSVEFGIRRSVAAMAGCLLALLLILSASAAGLTALLIALPGAFEVLRYAGAAYLIYLGIRAWRAGAAPLDIGDDTLTATMGPAKLFRGGLVIGLSNPKLLLFAAAFLPQFVNPAAPQAPQFAVLIATFAATEMFWYLGYGLGGRTLARFLRTPAAKRAFDGLTGLIFVGFGLALLRARPA